MGRKVAGTVYMKVDGRQLVVVGGVECPVGDVVRESIEGAPGYYSEKERQPYVQVDVLHTPDFPLSDLAKGTDMTVQVEFQNGRSYVLTDAYLVEEPASTGDDGQISLRFDGVKGVWQ